jgi:hypothetical protein
VLTRKGVVVHSEPQTAAMVGSPWSTIAGLVCDVVGVAIVAGASIPWTYEQRMTRAFMRIAAATPDENRRTKSYREIILTSWLTALGVALIGVGFVLQIVGTWP